MVVSSLWVLRMTVVLSVFEVLEGLVWLELSLGLVSSLLLKKLLHKRIFVADM